MIAVRVEEEHPACETVQRYAVGLSGVKAPLLIDGSVEAAGYLAGVMRNLEPTEHLGVVLESAVRHVVPIVKGTFGSSSGLSEIVSEERRRRCLLRNVAEATKNNGPSHDNFLPVYALPGHFCPRVGGTRVLSRPALSCDLWSRYFAPGFVSNAMLASNQILLLAGRRAINLKL